MILYLQRAKGHNIAYEKQDNSSRFLHRKEIILLITKKYIMLSCANSRFDPDYMGMTSLREEFSAVYALQKEMSVFGRDSLYKDYLTKLGNIDLQLLILSVDVMELRLSYRQAEKRITEGKHVELDQIRSEVSRELSNLKQLINKNSVDLIMAWNAQGPSKEERYVLTELLKQIAFLAHPLFRPGEEESVESRRILRRAERTYGELDRDGLTEILAEARVLDRDNPVKTDSRHMALVREGILRNHIRIERNRELFPHTLEHKLSDPAWIAEETARMKREYDKLLAEKEDYAAKLANFSD